MAQARCVWVPYPYQAGFCITDDCDASDMESVRLVYDHLRSLGLVATKTVWAFAPSEPSGIPPTPDSTLRGITLEDKVFFDYCLELKDAGFEICLHGASAGNNTRERTSSALELIERHFGSNSTYVCHAKNAENVYWGAKVAPTPFLRSMVGMYSRYRSYGEIPGSRYFWGDLCRDRVRQIRLFRTRNRNTLAANPSMPYFEESKPFVRGWFSASKRSLRDCTTEPALARLKSEHGLTVLYQYMHRYADVAGHRVLPGFAASTERLAGTSGIWVRTTTEVMDRLRQMQRVFVVYRQNHAWLVNANDREVPEVQVALPPGVTCLNQNDAVAQSGSILRIPSAGPGFTRLEFNQPVTFAGPRTARLDDAGRALIDFGHGSVRVNLGELPWEVREAVVPAGRFEVVFAPGLEQLQPRSKAGKQELTRLFWAQARIILRETLLKGRSLSTDRFLSADEIELEDHDNW